VTARVRNVGYNTNIFSLLRHPKLDLLIAEYDEDILEKEGMFYQGSNMVVLDNPTETEMMLRRNTFDESTIIIKEGNEISIQRRGMIEDYTLGEDEPFSRVYLKEIATVI
jgi:cyanophycin synthetase